MQDHMFSKALKKVLLNPVITYPPYSPDLALCNFDLIFLSSDNFECERLSDEITVIVSKISEFESLI